VNRESESQRILAEYERRDRVLPADFYSLHHLANLFQHQEHERMLLRCLQRAGRTPLTDQRIVDLGCGEGNWLRVFEGLGALQENLAGIELGDTRAEITRRRLPAADIQAGDATALPWPDRTFDVVFQRMMFTSILDPALRKAAAAEMMRVARSDGSIIWVDFFLNPRNSHVHPLGKQDIRALFPGWRAKFYRTTLAPPIARRLAPISWTLARVFESVKLFNTFYFALLQPDR
jgi:ubiquinone/menaquinone biosynthesis C-methylase UbiE